jgi:Cu/Ag efflux pump CusA
MMRWIVGSSLKFRRLVIAIAVILMAVGITRLRSTPVEALPEFTPPQVEVQTEALGLSAEEVEQLITNPMEQEFFNGIPWLAKLRSDSVPGLSSIQMIFEPGTDPIRARQMVQERLTMVAALPAVSKPPFVIQPLSSTSRLMMIGLSSKDVSLIDMSVLARWKIRPTLMGVPGVANVAIWGMRDRQLQVQVEPGKLRKNGVSLDQVIRTTGNALWVSPLTYVEASTPGTGGFIDTANQRIEIQHTSPIKTAGDLAKVTIEGAERRSLTLGDVATVVEGHQPLIGDAVVQDAPSLMLVVERFPEASVSDTTRGVERALETMKPGLTGLQMDTTVFRPATFLDSALENLTWTLIIGFALLLLVLGAFLFDWRAALIAVVAIALSVVTAGLVLSLFGATLNTMVLAGLVMAIAVLVDDAILDVHNIRRRLHERHPEQTAESRMATILAASLEMRGLAAVATVIALVSVVPVVVLGGVSGSFLRPVAVAYTLSILASMLVALTVTPAMAMLLFTRAPLERGESPFARRLERRHAAVLGRLVERRGWAFVAAGVVVLAGLALLPQLGGRRLTPELQDRNLLIRWNGAPGLSLPEMNRVTALATRELRSVPGVADVGAHVGRASMSDALVGASSGELWVTIDPAADYAKTVATVQAVVNGYPGLSHDIRTYPAERVRQVTTGAKEPLVVRVYGNSFDSVQAKADEVARMLGGVDGVVRPQVRTQPVEPTVEIEVFIAKAARAGVKPGDVRRAAATILSGITAGSLFEEQKVFDVVVWGAPDTRRSLTDIRELLIDTPSGRQVRLGDVADVRIRPTQSVIKHDAVSRTIDVVADLRGRSVGEVTRDVEGRLLKMSWPKEHHAEVLADTAQQQNDQRRLLYYVIAAGIVIFFLLQAAFGSWRLASLLFLLLPVASAGAVLVAAIRGDAVSTISLLGLLAVLGIAARGGILQVRQYQRLERDGGEPLGRELVLRGTRERFAPTVASALAAGLVLAPLTAVGAVAGLEVVNPLAAIVLGGLVTTVLVNLLILPTFYLRFAARPRPGPADPHVSQRGQPDAAR